MGPVLVQVCFCTWKWHSVIRSDYDIDSAKLLKFLEEVDKRYDVVWLSDEICLEDRCRAKIDETFIYRDAGHLSVEGARYIGNKMGFYGRITSRE